VNVVAETILDVFLSTGFTGDVCTWFIEENPNYDLPMLFVEFRVRDKLHVICGLVPEALALEGIQELNAKYKMIRIDNSTVQ
jgi:hypothetical protein